MKRTYKFAKSSGTIKCTLKNGEEIELPVIQGILKHPSLEMLRLILKNPDTATRYTNEALRKAAWQVLVLFPKPWLCKCLFNAQINQRRRTALEFLLDINKPVNG